MRDLLISIDEFRQVIGTADAPAVLDVRREDAFAQAERTLPTARWCAHTSIDRWLGLQGRRASVVVACRHGHNVSQAAAAVLRQTSVEAYALAGGVEGWIAAGAPSILKDPLLALASGAPTTWVTRVRPKIDRIACPWLIRRFIDRDARFLFVEPAHVLEVARELGAIAFDVEGAELSHDGPMCSFDTLLRRFGLSDPALDRLALIVRGADTARMDLAPEAAGLLAVSLGVSSLSAGDDHAALERGFPVYDALYAWARHASHETHNWPARSA